MSGVCFVTEAPCAPQALPVLAHPAILGSLGARHGFVTDGTRMLAVAIRSKFGFFSQAICGTSCVLLDGDTIDWHSAPDVQAEQAFLDAALPVLAGLGVDGVLCPPTYTLFAAPPTHASSCPFGSYRIDLTVDEDTLFAAVHSKHRNVIRKAEKDGIQIIHGPECLDAVHALCAATMRREGLSFTAREAYRVFAAALGEHGEAYVATLNGVPQAGAFIPFDAQAGYYLHGGSVEHPAGGAANLLQWAIIRDLKARGTQWYDFVGARIQPAPGTRLEGIQRFKARFGAVMHTGYLWKANFRHTHMWLFEQLRHTRQVLRREPYAGDIIDQEQLP